MPYHSDCQLKEDRRMAGVARIAGWVVVATALAALGTHTAAAAEDDFDLGGDGKECKSFSCNAGKAAVPKRPLKLVSQGCNSMGGISMMGGGMGQDEVTPCCNLRQACFQTCGSSKTKCQTVSSQL